RWRLRAAARSSRRFFSTGCRGRSGWGSTTISSSITCPPIGRAGPRTTSEPDRTAPLPALAGGGGARRTHGARLPAGVAGGLRLGRQQPGDRQRPAALGGRPAPDLVQHRALRLLAGDADELLGGVASVGPARRRLPRGQPGAARRLLPAALGGAAALGRAGSLAGRAALRRTPGERGIGGLDRGAQESAGDALLPRVDLLVCGRRKGLRPEPGGLRAGDAEQRFGGDPAARPPGPARLAPAAGEGGP